MKKRHSTLTMLFFCLVSIIAAAAVCVTAALAALGGVGGVKSAVKFAAINGIIDEYYIGEEDRSGTADDAFSAMIDSLDDRWSYYMTAEEYKEYKLYSQNLSIGVGVTISIDAQTGGMLVESVYDGSEAQRAGIVPSDIILAVAGRDVTGFEIEQVRSLIREQGESVFSMMIRTAQGTERTVELKAGSIAIDPVRHELRPDGLGYIQIVNFENGAAEGIIAAVSELMESGAAGLIFDVRGNRGGKVSELTKALDFLLPEGDIFISADKSGKETVTRSDAECIETPMAVLINAGSSSAAEFFAAAISEYGVAATVGEQTTGKSRSQITLELKDGSAVHISSGAYLTPLRVDLAAQGGLKPDLPVAMGNEGDAQLDAAAALLLGG